MFLAIIILAAVAIFTVLLRVIFRTVVREYASVHRVAWIGVVVATAGASLVFYQSHHIENHRRILDWPSVAGKVVASEVAGSLSYHPEVLYEYTVDSMTYRDSSSLLAPGFGGKRKRDEVAVKEIANYWPGREVTVHYNPDNPSESLLLTRLSWAVYGQLGLGGTLFMLGMLLILWPRRKKSLPETTA